MKIALASLNIPTCVIYREGYLIDLWKKTGLVFILVALEVCSWPHFHLGPLPLRYPLASCSAFFFFFFLSLRLWPFVSSFSRMYVLVHSCLKIRYIPPTTITPPPSPKSPLPISPNPSLNLAPNPLILVLVWIFRLSDRVLTNMISFQVISPSPLTHS